MIDVSTARRAWAVLAACVLGLLSTLYAHAADAAFPANPAETPRALVVVDAEVPEPELLLGGGEITSCCASRRRATPWGRLPTNCATWAARARSTWSRTARRAA